MTEFRWPFGPGVPFFVSSIDAWMSDPDQPGGIFERADRLCGPEGDRLDAMRIAEFFAPRGAWRLEDSIMLDWNLALLTEAMREVRRYRNDVGFRFDQTWSDALDQIVGIRGISYPLATGFLHTALEGEFPVVGEPPLWALGVPNKRAPRGKLTRDYVRFVREQADREGISVRSANAALWQRGRLDMGVGR